MFCSGWDRPLQLTFGPRVFETHSSDRWRADIEATPSHLPPSFQFKSFSGLLRHTLKRFA